MSSLHDAIRTRRTTKVFAESPLDLPTDRDQIDGLIEAAAWAPFHRPAHKSHLTGEHDSLVPWRMYAVDADGCRELRSRLLDSGDAGKLPQMLAAAHAVVQCTWLPDPPAAVDFDGLFEPTINNMEHIAAAGAAVEHLLLAATEQGYETYWSSGGALRFPNAFGWLGIPLGEILLGAVFLFPSDETGTTRVPGKLRERRGDVRTWSRWVELTDANGVGG